MPRESGPGARYLAAMTDLDAYFLRTGYTGSRAPTLETLSGIVLAHTRSIPFENLDVLLGRPILLDPAALLQKLVHDHRGGSCFEQTGLLLHVLEALGFDVVPISARVRIGRPLDVTPPRTHVFLRLEIDGVSWLADVGVGGMSPTAPLRLHTDAPQPTPHETRRIVCEGAMYYHQVLLGADWADVCEFTLETMPLIDREVASWFTSAHPRSHFRNRLLVALAGPPGHRLTVVDKEFSERGPSGVAQVSAIPDDDALLAILRERFGLAFEPGTRFPVLPS